MAKNDDIDMIEKDAKNVASGTLDKADVWIIEVGGKQPATFWIDKKQGLVRQIKTGKATVQVKIEDVNAVADKEFELPAGTKVQSMADMMKGMSGPGGPPAPPR